MCSGRRGAAKRGDGERRRISPCIAVRQANNCFAPGLDAKRRQALAPKAARPLRGFTKNSLLVARRSPSIFCNYRLRLARPNNKKKGDDMGLDQYAFAIMQAPSKPVDFEEVEAK